MAISDSLAKRVESDVKGSQEAAVEAAVKDALSDLKNKFKYQESYLSTLYDTGFQAYLKDRTFNSPEKLAKEITAINNIKLKLINQWLEAKKSAEHSPNFVTRNVIYPICWISQELSKNTKIGNVVKWVIDELMAIPDMVLQILKNPAEFAKSLWQLIKNPKDLWNWLKQAYWDAFTQWLATPDAQYRTWRSVTLIALTFLPWGAAKFWLNVAKWWIKTTTKQIWKITAKNAAKSTVKTWAKNWAKNVVKSAPKSVARKTETALKWHTGWVTMRRELNWWARTYAEREVTRNAGKIVEETKAATKAGRAAEMPAAVKSKFRQWVDRTIAWGDTMPVLKQINSITKWTFKKLDKWTEAILKNAHPKFYEKLWKQQKALERVKATAEWAAKKLEEQTITTKVAEQNAKIAEIEKAIATKTGKKYNAGHLTQAKNKLATLEWELEVAQKAERSLRTKLRNANETYLVHQEIIEWLNKAETAGKIAIWIETQQVVSVLDRAQIETLDREIEEAISEIDEATDDIDDISEELENLLKDYEWSSSWLNSWETVFQEDNISIDLPEWTNLSEVDPSTYTITLTWLASKTWSRAVNERIAQQRAESAKQILIEKYGITDKGQIVIKTDLQSDHPESLNDSLSDWQWVRIKLELNNKSDDSSLAWEEGDPDAELERALDEIE